MNVVTEHTGPIILFDGVCNLCNSSVDMVIRHDKKSIFRFASLQSEYAKNLLDGTSINLKDPDSIVYYNAGKIKQKSNAVLAIARNLGLPFSLLVVFKVIPRFLRNYLYDVIARNRYSWFGKKSTCRIPSDAERERFFN